MPSKKKSRSRKHRRHQETTELTMHAQSIGGSEPYTTVSDWQSYPYSLDGYLAGVDEGDRYRQQLTTSIQTWRNEQFSQTSNVDVYDLFDGNTDIHCEQSDVQLEDLLQTKEQPDIRYIFLDNYASQAPKTQVVQHQDKGRRGEISKGGGGNIETFNITSPMLLKLLSILNLPTPVVGHIRGQGSSFGCRTSTYGEKDVFDMWFHLKAPAYDPEKDVSTELNVTIVTHYCWTTGKSVLIIKYRPYGVEVVCDEMKRQVKESLSIRPTSLLSDDPFALHLIHLFLYVQFWWNALRGPRSYVGHQEATAHIQLSEINVARLHMCTRVLDTYKADLDLFADTMCSLIREHDQFLVEYTNRLGRSLPQLSKRVSDDFRAFENQLRQLTRTTDTISNRAKHLLNLYFNMVMVQDSKSTSRMASLARQDSISMVSIAVLTMIFLPATFICTLLGSNIFSYSDDEGLTVSPLWWVMPVAALPLTALLMVLWYFWRRREIHRVRSKHGYGTNTQESEQKSHQWSQLRTWAVNEAKEQEELTLLGMHAPAQH